MGPRECSAVPSATPAMRREYGSEGVQCGAISSACLEKGGAAWRSGELVGAAAEREARQQQLHGREEGGGWSAEEEGAAAPAAFFQKGSGRRGSSSYTGGRKEAGWSAEEGAAAPAAFFQKGGAAWRSGELVGAAAEREARQQQLHGREEGGGLEGAAAPASSSFRREYGAQGGEHFRSGPKRWFPPHRGAWV
ncbi:unnamed protein product [Closterium sp. Naga37s-1]|nr:unnamed protein product [Closterium sp. Naga37s-1]